MRPTHRKELAAQQEIKQDPPLHFGPAKVVERYNDIPQKEGHEDSDHQQAQVGSSQIVHERVCDKRTIGQGTVGWVEFRDGNVIKANIVLRLYENGGKDFDRDRGLLAARG